MRCREGEAPPPFRPHPAPGVKGEALRFPMRSWFDWPAERARSPQPRPPALSEPQASRRAGPLAMVATALLLLQIGGGAARPQQASSFAATVASLSEPGG